MDSIKLMLVDSEEIFLEGLAEVLQHRLQTDTVLRGRSVSEILRCNPGDPPPDVVIMGKDLSTPNIHDCIKKTKELLPETKVAMMLQPEEDDDPVEILKSGALGCLTRNISVDDLVACIRLISTGRIIVSPRFTGRFLKGISPNGQDENHKNDILSGREVEIAALVAQGKTNREISTSLFVTENTIKAHLRNILGKLHFKNRQQLVAYTVLKNRVAMGVLLLVDFGQYDFLRGLVSSLA